MKDKEKTALIALVISMSIFGTTLIFRHYMNLPSAFIAFSRGVSGSIFVALFCLITKKKLSRNFSKKSLLLTIISGILLGLNWLLLFESTQLAGTQVAELLNYMEPTLVILFAPVFLNEKLTLKKVICAFVAIFGMTLVSGFLPASAGMTINLKGVIYGFISGVFYAAIVIINRKIPDVDPYEKTMIQLMCAGLAMLPTMIMNNGFDIGTPDARSIVFLVIICIIHTGFCYLLMFKGFSGLPAQTSALLSYIDPISSLIISAMVIGNTLSFYGVIGAVCILGATIISEMNLKNKKAAA